MSSSGLLLAVSGMTPQIVTETLYGIHQEGQPLPERIVLVTSASGRQMARTLAGPDGQIARLCRDYGLPVIPFETSDIRVITGADGNPLPDIRTVEENNAAADFLINLVRELTLDEAGPLHVSLAGGRKTMGFYIGYALSLFGRDQDRLSHVLVSEGYEGQREFYYPTPDYREITVSDQKVLDASKARVELADIPFLRLRDLLPDNTLTEKRSFSETVRESQIDACTGHIVIHPDNQYMDIDGRRIRVTTLQGCYYAWLLSKHQGGGTGPQVGEVDDDVAKDHAADFLRFCQDISEDLDAPSLRGPEPVIDQNWLRNQRTGINNALKKGLGRILAKGYHVTSAGQQGRKTQHVNLEGYVITVVGPKTLEFSIDE